MAGTRALSSVTQDCGPRSGSERYLLVDADLELGQAPPVDTPARVLHAGRGVDGGHGILFEPNYFHSITAHVPTFRSYDAADGELDALLDGVEARGPPTATVGGVDR